MDGRTVFNGPLVNHEPTKEGIKDDQTMTSQWSQAMVMGTGISMCHPWGIIQSISQVIAGVRLIAATWNSGSEVLGDPGSN